MELYSNGVEYSAEDLPALLNLVRDLSAESLNTALSVTSPSVIADYLIGRLSGEKSELFCIAFLSNRHKLIDFRTMFRGTIDTTSVYPREIIRAIIETNAAAIILAHNHPSGEPDPSDADKIITRRIKSAAELIDVRVLDHFVIGGGKAISMAERGLF